MLRLSCAVAFVLVCLGWAWLPFGLDHFDQGYLLSAADGLLEYPEDVVPLKTGGLWLTLLLQALLLEIGGDYGTLLFRLAALPIALAVTVAGCALVRHTMGLPALIAGGAFTHFVARSWRVDGFLSYPLLSAFGFAIASLLLVEGSDRRRRGLIVLGGAALGANVFIRTPNLAGLALLAVPAALQLLSGRGLSHAARQTGWATLGSCCGAAAILVLMTVLGHERLYFEALTDLASMAQAEGSPYEPLFLLAKLGLEIATAQLFLLELLIVAVVGNRVARAGDERWWRVGVVVVGGLAGSVLLGDLVTSQMVLYAVVFLPLLASLLRSDAGARDRVVDGVALAVLLLLPVGAAAGLGTGAAVAALFSGPVAFSRIVQAIRASESPPAGAGVVRWHLMPTRVSAGIVGLALLTNAIVRLPETSRDRSGIGYPARALSSVSLPGVWMDPDRAAMYDELVLELDKHSTSGDFLLAFPHVPFVYFLTNRRPYLSETWPLLRTTTFLRDRLRWARSARSRLPVVVRATGRSLSWTWPHANEKRRERWVMQPPGWLTTHHARVHNSRDAALELLGFQSLESLQYGLFRENRLILFEFLARERYRAAWVGEGRNRFEIMIPPEEHRQPRP